MDEAVTVLKSSQNQQALKKLLVSMGEQLRDNADLIFVIKQLVSKLPEASKREYHKSHRKDVVDEINAAIKIIQSDPRYLDDFLYKTEKQIFSNKDKATMRSIGLWRSATKEEYIAAGLLNLKLNFIFVFCCFVSFLFLFFFLSHNFFSFFV